MVELDLEINADVVMDSHGHHDPVTTIGVAAEAEKRVEKEVKLSFIDVLKSNPNLGFEEKKKRRGRGRGRGRSSVVTMKNNGSDDGAMPQFGSYNPTPLDVVKPAVDGVAMRAAEKRVWEATRVKDGIQQRVEAKEAACEEAKHVYEAVVSDEKALRVLLEAKNVMISEAQSVLKRLKSAEDLLGKDSGLKTVILADGMKAILDALVSSGIGIHDLDWLELVDELLQPLKKEAVLVKEDIRKAEGFTKASKKNYDNRTEELNVLKGQLREADSVLREANRDLMRLLNKEFTEEKEGLKSDQGDENRTKDASNPPGIGLMDLGYHEACEEDAGGNFVKAIENGDACTEKTAASEDRCKTDQTSDPEDGCKPEKIIENEDICIEQTVDTSMLTFYADQTLEHEDGCNSEQGMAELSAVEAAEEEKFNNDHHNILPADPQPDKTQRTSNNKKKQKRRARKARAKAARVLTLHDHLGKRFISFLKLPQVCLALSTLSLIGILLTLWSAS